jgi:hypothetical protein
MFGDALFACALPNLFLSGKLLPNLIADRIEFSNGLLLSYDMARIFHSAATRYFAPAWVGTSAKVAIGDLYVAAVAWPSRGGLL